MKFTIFWTHPRPDMVIGQAYQRPTIQSRDNDNSQKLSLPFGLDRGIGHSLSALTLRSVRCLISLNIDMNDIGSVVAMPTWYMILEDSIFDQSHNILVRR